MAYLARQDTFFDQSVFHVTWLCHNESWFLESDDAKQILYDLMLKNQDKYGIFIYSYCFMSNHPHITGYATTREGLSGFMKAVNSQFAKKINKQLKRRGQVVMDRFVSATIATDEDMLAVMGYIDLNPTRAGMILDPKEYEWSSYRYYAYGEADPLITPAPSYLGLGANPEERQMRYREMVETIIRADKLKKQHYSKTRYIGNPDWVKARYEEINEVKRNKRLAYLERRKKFLYSQQAP